MKIIDKIVIDNKAPKFNNVIWIDTSKPKPILRCYLNGEWEPLGSSLSGDIDATPMEGSTNPVQSGGVYEVLEGKLDNEELHIRLGFPVFDASLYYSQGDLVMYNGDLYTFTTEHHGQWDVDDVEPYDIYKELKDLYVDLAEQIDAKQDVISDLSTIRSGAAAGATALQPSDITSIENAVSIIESVIPAQASAQNQLADKNFVNSQVTTASANFVGTFETLAELQAVQNPTKNDYGFVIETDTLGNQYYDRHKYNGTTWLFEYKVESTSFTSEQWAAIQSGITSVLVQKINNVIPSNASSSNKLATTSDVNEKLNAPATAGTSGQVLTSDGQGGQSWQTPQSEGVTDVTVGGTSVVSNGVAVVPAIPAVPTISTDIASDATSDTKTTSPKAVKTFVDNQGYGTYSKPSGGIPASDLASGVIPNSVVNVTSQQDGTVVLTKVNGDTITIDLNHVHPQYYSKVREAVMPQGGFLPDVVYSLGVLSSNTTFSLAPMVVGNTNHYYWTFSTATTAIDITWPTRLIWVNGSEPTIAANKHYEISILDNFAAYMETSIQEND